MYIGVYAAQVLFLVWFFFKCLNIFWFCLPRSGTFLFNILCIWNERKSKDLQFLNWEAESKSCPCWTSARHCSGLSHCSTVLLVDQVNIQGSEHGQSGSICITLKWPPSDFRDLSNICLSLILGYSDLFDILFILIAGFCSPMNPKHVCHPVHSELMWNINLNPSLPCFKLN